MSTSICQVDVRFHTQELLIFSLVDEDSCGNRSCGEHVGFFEKNKWVDKVKKNCHELITHVFVGGGNFLFGFSRPLSKDALWINAHSLLTI